MTKAEKLRNKYNESLRDRERLTAEIEAIEARRPALEMEAEKMAEAGDVDSYLTAKTLADRAEAELHVKKVQLAKLEHPISKNEAAEAWAEISKTQNAAIKKKIAAYERARQALYSQFIELVNSSRDLDGQRRALLEYCGISAASDGLNFKSELANFHMVPLSFEKLSDDINFFQKAGLISIQESQDLRTFLFSGLF